MTTSIETMFGSHQMVDGFLLNNEFTDFSFIPERGGKPVANRVDGGKRPRSAMSPTLIFDAAGRLFMVIGSPGGPPIINYVGKTVVGVIDGGLDIQSAIHLPNVSNRGTAAPRSSSSAARRRTSCGKGLPSLAMSCSKATSTAVSLESS